MHAETDRWSDRQTDRQRNGHADRKKETQQKLVTIQNHLKEFD